MLDQLASTLNFKEGAQIELATAHGVVNPIGAHVYKVRGGANWYGASVYCVIFFA